MGYIQTIRRQIGRTPLILNSASGTLLNSANQILLQERADTGDWGFPGGYLEFGETFKQAVMREFHEDVGVLIVPTHRLWISDDFVYKYPNGDEVQAINFFYLVQYIDGNLISHPTKETQSLRFFDLETPPTLFNQQHMEMLRVLKQYMKHL